MIRYGHARNHYHGAPRDEMPSRERGPVERPERYIGRILCDFPGWRVEWACHQDMRDLRRFRAVDLDGIATGDHGTPKALLAAVAARAPVYAAQRW